MKRSPSDPTASRSATSALCLLLALTVGAGCGSEVDDGDFVENDDPNAVELATKSADSCTNSSTRPIEQDRWDSRDPLFGYATFVFYNFDKHSRNHVVPIHRGTRYQHVYVIEVGSQSRNPANWRIIKRVTSPNVRLLGGGGSTDKYQYLHELAPYDSTGSVTFTQPMTKGGCIRDEGQYVVVYTNKRLRQTSVAMRDRMLTGRNNQYAGATSVYSFSLIADDETTHPNRMRVGGGTRRMLDSADFYAFEHRDNGFFLYKSGSRVPTFTGNGCDAQYEFY